MRRLSLVLVLTLVSGVALGACDAFTDDDETQDEQTDDEQTDDEQTDDEQTDDEQTDDEQTDDEQTDERTDEEQTDGDSDQGEDQDLADDIVLTLDDLPEGFTQQDEDDDATDDDDDEGFSPADEQFEDCVTDDLLETLVDLETGDEGAEAQSPDFESEDTLQFVGSAAFVVPNDEVAVAFYDLFTGDCFRDAFLQSFEDEAEEGGEFTDTGIEPIEGIPDLGDDVGGFAIRATFSDPSGFELDLAIDMVVLRTGRAVAFMFTGGVIAPFPTTDRDELLELMAERMEPAA